MCSLIPGGVAVTKVVSEPSLQKLLCYLINKGFRKRRLL